MATHSGTSLFAGQSVADGASVDSAAIDNTAGLGITFTAQVANGGTAPTTGCGVTVLVSHDGTTYVQWAKDVAGVAANTTYPFGYELPKDILFAKLRFGGHAGAAITASAQSHQTTGI